MTIRVLSFDFDGCLFNRAYAKACDLPGPKDRLKLILDHNELLFAKLKEEIANQAYTKVIGFVGSNRQSKMIDDQNAGTSGSCFRAMRAVATHLGIELNELLLADIYENLTSGLSYDRAINYSLVQAWEAKFKHADCTFDASKISLLYAQIHSIALKHPGEELIFDFYDDRFDILGGLDDFFLENPLWLPSNVCLHLHRYAGGELENYKPIQGKGLVDKGYRETVKAMGDLAKRNLRNPNSPTLAKELVEKIAFKYDRQFLVSLDELLALAVAERSTPHREQAGGDAAEKEEADEQRSLTVLAVETEATLSSSHSFFSSEVRKVRYAPSDGFSVISLETHLRQSLLSEPLAIGAPRNIFPCMAAGNSYPFFQQNSPQLRAIKSCEGQDLESQEEFTLKDEDLGSSYSSSL